MAKKQVKAVEPEPVAEDELFDPTTEQPIAVDVLEPVVTYTPSVNEPHLAVHMELPMAVLFALIEPENPQTDYAGAVYYGLLIDGVLTPIGEKVLAGVDQTLLRHKLNAAARIAHNQRIDRGA